MADPQALVALLHEQQYAVKGDFLRLLQDETVQTRLRDILTSADSSVQEFLKAFDTVAKFALPTPRQDDKVVAPHITLNVKMPRPKAIDVTPKPNPFQKKAG